MQEQGARMCRLPAKQPRQRQVKVEAQDAQVLRVRPPHPASDLSVAGR